VPGGASVRGVACNAVLRVEGGSGGRRGSGEGAAGPRCHAAAARGRQRAGQARRGAARRGAARRGAATAAEAAATDRVGRGVDSRREKLESRRGRARARHARGTERRRSARRPAGWGRSDDSSLGRGQHARQHARAVQLGGRRGNFPAAAGTRGWVRLGQGLDAIGRGGGHRRGRGSWAGAAGARGGCGAAVGRPTQTDRGRERSAGLSRGQGHQRSRPVMGKRGASRPGLRRAPLCERMRAKERWGGPRPRSRRRQAREQQRAERARRRLRGRAGAAGARPAPPRRRGAGRGARLGALRVVGGQLRRVEV
jgi:hypothetical protein